MINDVEPLLNIIEQSTTTYTVYSKSALSNLTRQKLLDYQESHVIRMINILLAHNIALDASDTGIGKTYIASAICKELKKNLLLFAPKL